MASTWARSTGSKADRIELAKSDPSSGGEHPYIGLGQVETADDVVHLSTTGAEAASSVG